MAFSAETENLVEQLIQVEYKNACKIWGDKYHSLHEGYAILYEEVEEAKFEIDRIDALLRTIWQEVKKSQFQIYMKDDLSKLNQVIYSSIKELAQVGAVLMKICNTIGEVEE